MMSSRCGTCAPATALFIPGNHEYFFGYQAWMRHLSGMGMDLLANDHTVLQRGGGRLVVAGVTDLSAPETGNAPPDKAGHAP